MDANGWISVDERLPEATNGVKTGDVLAVNSDGEIFVGYYYHDDEEWVDSEGYTTLVTHWQPLPPLPAVSVAKE